MKTKLLLIPAVAAMLTLAACQNEDEQIETEETVEDTSAESVEETETVEEVVEEEETPNPYNEYDQEVGIYPEEDADIEGSDDVDAAAKIAEDMATNDMASRLKAYKRLIEPLDTDEHDAFNAQTAYDAIESTNGRSHIWDIAGAEYIKAHHPDLDPYDDRDEIRDILRDPEQGAFRIGTVNGAISRMQMIQQRDT